MDMAKAPEPVPPLRTPGYSGAFSQPLPPLQPLQPLQSLQPGVETDLPAKQVWEI
jgi:hypothetical protein